MEAPKRHSTLLLSFLLILVAMTAVYLYMTLGKTQAQVLELTRTVHDRDATIVTNQTRVTELETLLSDTKTMLENTITERDTLSQNLDEEKDRNDAFENQIKKIGSTVGTLDKLAKTDPELLKKYSKVYFLNENYTPAKLTEISKDYVYHTDGEPEFINTQVAPFFKEMEQDALDEGVKLWVVSAYRSFDEQRALKSTYTVSYGSGANTFSADQGYSEHQLGTTIDLTTENMNGGLTVNFETTPAYAWLTKHAHKYGFVLSYPKNNAYYMYEPWHWRFVGVDLARDLHDDGKYFYDLDQREIDTYLISLFD